VASRGSGRKAKDGEGSHRRGASGCFVLRDGEEGPG
jgi:hypothetical protein